MSDMFSPVRVGPYELKNRFVLSPLTRCRADKDHVPTDIMTTYFTQRACAELFNSPR